MRHTIDNTLRLAEVHPPRVSQPRLAFFKDSLMKQIPLTQEKFAIVDDEDYEYLMQWKWHTMPSKNGKVFYAVRTIGKYPNSRTIWMHREIMKAPHNLQIDHINHDGLDNRRCNLRLCTNSQNQQNSLPKLGHTSRFKGVSWRKGRRTWLALIRHKNKLYHLGTFKTEIEAAKSYDQGAKKHFGQFAYTNFKENES